MNSLLNIVRNKFESNKVGLSLLDFLTRNVFYRKFIFWLADKRIKSIVSGKKFAFAIEVTSFCNANCSFCPNSRMKRHKSIMSMDIFLKLVERIKEEDICPTQFNLAGTGEPLLDKDLFKKIEILKDCFPNVEVYFPTNLALANKEIQEKIVNSRVDYVSVSLNADNASDYKKIMNLDFKNTIDNLEGLISVRNKTKSKLKIYLKLAANPVNIESVNSFINRWKKRVDGVGVSWIHSWAGAVDNGDENTDNIERFPCRQLFSQIVIHANGNIPLCCVDYEGKVIGGNVMEDKLLEAFNGKDIDAVRKLHREGNIKKMTMCANCRFSERGLYWLVD